MGTETWADARDRDPALEQVLQAVYPWAQRLALLLTRDAHSASDLVQDAILQALRRPPEPLTAEVLQAWLRRVMLRLHLRRQRSLLRELRAHALLGANSPARGPTLSEPTDELMRALDKLGPRQRACLILRYFEDLPEPRIAEVLGIREGTVKAHLAQARERLRGILKA